MARYAEDLLLLSPLAKVWDPDVAMSLTTLLRDLETTTHIAGNLALAFKTLLGDCSATEKQTWTMIMTIRGAICTPTR